MALVNVVNVTVLDNPTCFLNPFQFEITFECLQELDDDLEWKILYVGSAHDAHKDQILDEILVGPVPVGMNKFVLQANSPDYIKLPPDDVLGVTVVLITCSYKEREFVRIGYYVNNEYVDGTDTIYNEENPPPTPLSSKFNIQFVQRQILADKPRVTKFPISWNNNNNTTTTTTENNIDESNMIQQDISMDQDLLEENDDDQYKDVNEEEIIDDVDKDEDIMDDDEEDEEDDDDDNDREIDIENEEEEEQRVNNFSGIRTEKMAVPME